MVAPNWVVRQLAGPHGLFARGFARLLNAANAAESARAVQVLAPERHHTALDLGFGGGVALPALLSACADGRVVGIEPAIAMRARALRRWAWAAAEGRLSILDGAAEAIPLAGGEVHRAITMNTVYFWRDVPAGFAELHRVLRPGGRLVVGVAPAAHLRAMGFDEAGYRVAEPEAYAASLRAAGFSVTEVPPPTQAECALLVATR
jgi:arsenite methyltransferase